MSHPFDRVLGAELEELDRLGRRRSTDEVTSGVDFTSNDYLGLSRHPRVVEAARDALEREGFGAGAARLLARDLAAHRQLEGLAAEWVGSVASLLFPSGYQANVGTVCALAGPGTVLHSDRRVHASLIDGARLSRAEVRVHGHLDLEHLEADLRSSAAAARRLVLTESIFSMDGDAAPIAALCELCARYDAWLLVDEAHALGLLGPRGAGAVAAATAAGAPTERVVARILTGGKSLGGAGALVAGSAALRELLVNRARPFVFSTAPPPSTAAGLAAAIEVAADSGAAARVCLERASDLAAGLGRRPPDAAIVPLAIGGDVEALAAATALAEQGFAVRAIRPPTVPEGSARLRLVTHSFNSAAEVDGLVRALRRAGLAAAGSADGGAEGPTRATATTSLQPRGGPPPPPLPPRPTHPFVGADVAVTGHRARDRRTSSLGRALIVAGTDTGVGKTVLSAVALRALLRSGPAGYWKPIQTGADDDTAEVRRLAEAPGSLWMEPLCRYPLPASPHEAAAHAGDRVPVERLSPTLSTLRARSAERAWLVELAGGLLVPYRLDWLQLDWLREIRLPVLLAARSGLGTLNHTLLSTRALAQAGVALEALVLIGPPHPSNRSTLIALSGAPHVFELPWFEPLGVAALESWLDGARSHRGIGLPELLAGEGREQ